MEELQREKPEEHRRLSRLQEENPSAFRRELRRKASETREPGRGRGRSIRPHPLRDEILALRNAETDDAREAAVAGLREKIRARVDANLAEREKAIQDVRKKLQDLEQQNEQEQARREEIIDNHLQRVLRFSREKETPEDDTP
jgi:hypothetical protein